MMRNKKDFPLAVLKALEPYVNLKGDRFEVVEPKENLLKVLDKDLESNFHFTIEKYTKTDKGVFQFLVTRSPKNANDNTDFQAWLEAPVIGSHFQSWISLLNEYETVNSFFDDPITKYFEEEYYAEFEIVDDDAGTKPFTTKQILLLDSKLELISNELKQYETEDNKQSIKEIKEEIVLLREHLSDKPKKWVISKLSKIFAKIAKQGTKFIKEILSESKKELIKQGIKGAIEYFKENGQDLLS